MTQLRNQTAIRPAQPQPRPNADRVSLEAMRLQGAMRDLRAQAQTDKKKGGFGQVMKFALLPDLKSAFGGISQAWYLLVNTVAQLFVLAKLIDADHPAAKYQAEYRFKLTEVIKLASKRVKFDRAHALQTFMFFVIVAFLVVFALTGASFLLNMLIGTAHAQTNPGIDPVGTALLDNLFHLTSNGVIAQGLGAMLKFYSNTVLILAGIILIYIILSTVAETANSGVPFGKNFNHVWAPVRLIMALGLLIPLSGGLNSGQYVVLYLSKWGSDLSTSMWREFAQHMQLSQANFQKIATANAQATANQIYEMEKCAALENSDYAGMSIPAKNPNGSYIQLVRAQTSYDDVAISNTPVNTYGLNIPQLPAALNPQPSQKIIYTKFVYINPVTLKTCGSVVFPHYDNITLTGNASDIGGIDALASISFDDYLMRMRYKGYFTFRDKIKNLILANRTAHKDYDQQMSGENGQITIPDWQKQMSLQYGQLSDEYTGIWSKIVDNAYIKLKDQLDVNLTNEMGQIGWLGTPIWFYKVIQLNAALQAQALTMPRFDGVPQTGEGLILAALYKVQGSLMTPNVTGMDSVNINTQTDWINALAQSGSIEFSESLKKLKEASEDPDQKKGFWDKFLHPVQDVSSSGLKTGVFQALLLSKSVSDNIINIVGSTFGCPNVPVCMNNFKLSTDNPMTEIAITGQKFFNIGKDLLLSAGATNVVGNINPSFAGVAAVSTPLTVVGIAFLGMGFFLGFLIPFMPMLRFFGGVLGWIMLVIHMILAVPIIALGHLSTKGEGFMGDMRSAYANLLGLILRPILMILGLIMGLVAFTIALGIFNALFTPAVTLTFSLGTSNMFHAVAILVIYTLFIFAMCNSAFKMIDLVPDQVLQYINANLPRQGTQDDADQVGEKTRVAFGGAMLKSKEIGELGQQTAKGAGAFTGLLGKTGL